MSEQTKDQLKSESESTREQLEADLRDAMRNLDTIAKITAGTGQRGQIYIDDQVKKINIIRSKLGLKSMTAPGSVDDDCYGVFSGMAAFGQSFK